MQYIFQQSSKCRICREDILNSTFTKHTKYCFEENKLTTNLNDITESIEIDVKRLESAKVAFKLSVIKYFGFEEICFSQNHSLENRSLKNSIKFSTANISRNLIKLHTFQSTEYLEFLTKITKISMILKFLVKHLRVSSQKLKNELKIKYLIKSVIPLGQYISRDKSAIKIEEILKQILVGINHRIKAVYHLRKVCLILNPLRGANIGTISSANLNGIPTSNDMTIKKLNFNIGQLDRTMTPLSQIVLSGMLKGSTTLKILHLSNPHMLISKVLDDGQSQFTDLQTEDKGGNDELKYDGFAKLEQEKWKTNNFEKRKWLRRTSTLNNTSIALPETKNPLMLASLKSLEIRKYEKDRLGSDDFSSSHSLSINEDFEEDEDNFEDLQKKPGTILKRGLSRVNSDDSLLPSNSLMDLKPKYMAIKKRALKKLRILKILSNVSKPSDERSLLRLNPRAPHSFYSVSSLSFSRLTVSLPAKINSYTATNQGYSLGMSSFIFLCTLGQGAYGNVYLVEDSITKDKYALKVLGAKKHIDNEEMQKIMIEREVFLKLNSSHCVNALGSFVYKSFMCFVLEYVPGRDLFYQIFEVGKILIDSSNIGFYLAEVVLGLSDLHNAGIVHRDIKPQNILLDKLGHLKITDYGLSDVKGLSKPQEAKGSLNYMAPENFLDLDVGKEADWWAVGVLAFFLVKERYPFDGKTPDEMVKTILKYKIVWELDDGNFRSNYRTGRRIWVHTTTT